MNESVDFWFLCLCSFELFRTCAFLLDLTLKKSRHIH